MHAICSTAVGTRAVASVVYARTRAHAVRRFVACSPSLPFCCCRLIVIPRVLLLYACMSRSFIPLFRCLHARDLQHRRRHKGRRLSRLRPHQSPRRPQVRCMQPVSSFLLLSFDRHSPRSAFICMHEPFIHSAVSLFACTRFAAPPSAQGPSPQSSTPAPEPTPSAGSLHAARLFLLFLSFYLVNTSSCGLNVP